MQAWAKTVNQQGGIAGRKVVVDFIDSRLSPNDARNALITACSQDFALVGTEALFITNVSDLETCKNAQGQPVGIPDLSGIATSAERCSPVTYYLNSDAAYCATKDDHPQTYTAQQGDYRYYVKTNKDLHGIWLAPADVKDVKNAALPSYQAGMDLGIKPDGEGVYDVFARDPQSALDAQDPGREAERFDLRLQRFQRRDDDPGPAGGEPPGRQLGEAVGLSPGLLRPRLADAGGQRRRGHALPVAETFPSTPSTSRATARRAWPRRSVGPTR